MAHCAAARRIRRELDQQLAGAAAATGRDLVWTAADRVVLERIAATVDHISDLSRDYDATDGDVKLRLRVAGEIRLQDALLSRLLKTTPEIPAPMSRRSQKAQAAANVRWSRDAG